MTTKQNEQQNGMAKEPAQPLDLAAAQQMIAAARQEQRARFAAELDLLCKEYKMFITAEPYFDDGRTRARVVIKDAQ